MTEPKSTAKSFSEDDLFFTCPHCGKNMAIEKRGMGLTIQCPDCRGLVKVPKLSDAELKDLDGRHMPAESGMPDPDTSVTFLEEICHRLKSVQSKYTEVEKQFTLQQDAVQSLQKEVRHLQEAIDILAQQLSDAST